MNRAILHLPLALLVVLLGMSALTAARLERARPAEIRLAGFSTSLHGRSWRQRHNALLAARSLDGKMVAPGAIFSFNKVVKSWSVDEGYEKALVSYDGELLPAYGGGVCQTSTTLYNAALLAGLDIIERHPHVFAPGYVAPGRDAAVAFPGIDLRFRNNYAFPIRIRAHVVRGQLRAELFGAALVAPKIDVRSNFLSITKPLHLTRLLPTPYSANGEPVNRTTVTSAGTTGYRVLTYRVFHRDGFKSHREFLADNTYPAQNRITAISN